MNSPLPNASHFTHLDLTTGRRALIPFKYREATHAETLRIMLMSQRQNAQFTWAAGMHLFADLSNSGNGVAVLGLSAAFDMCGGKIKKLDPVYSMACAVSPRMQEVVWASLGNLYLNVMLNDLSHTHAALGDMPDDTPWVAGFAWPCTRALGEKGNLALIDYARVAAATLVNRCREVFVPDATKTTLRKCVDPETDDRHWA